MRAKAGLLAGVTLLVTACGGTVAGGGGGGGGGDAGSTEPLKIGVITGLTGAYVQLGEEQSNGAELAVKLLDGKAGDRPIELIVRDDQLKPDVALREAQALVQEEQVDFLTGCVSAATTLAINQIAIAGRRPLPRHVPDRAAQPAAELRRGDHLPPGPDAVAGHQRAAPVHLREPGPEGVPAAARLRVRLRAGGGLQDGDPRAVRLQRRRHGVLPAGHHRLQPLHPDDRGLRRRRPGLRRRRP